MAAGFLNVFLLMVAGWTLVGVAIGLCIAKRARKRGAVLGAIAGLVLGSVLASLTAFDATATKEPPRVVVG